MAWPRNYRMLGPGTGIRTGTGTAWQNVRSLPDCYSATPNMYPDSLWESSICEVDGVSAPTLLWVEIVHLFSWRTISQGAKRASQVAKSAKVSSYFPNPQDLLYNCISSKGIFVFVEQPSKSRVYAAMYGDYRLGSKFRNFFTKGAIRGQGTQMLTSPLTFPKWYLNLFGYHSNCFYMVGIWNRSTALRLPLH